MTVPLPPVPACPPGWTPLHWGDHLPGELARWQHRSPVGTVTVVLGHTSVGPHVTLQTGPGLHSPTWGLVHLHHLTDLQAGLQAAHDWLAACHRALDDEGQGVDHDQPTLWEVPV